MAEVTGTFRVVGVVENVAYDGLRSRHAPGHPLCRRGRSARRPLERLRAAVTLCGRTVSFAAASIGSAASLIDPIRRRIAQVAPTSAVHWTTTMENAVATEYAPARFYGVLIASFCSSAMLLTGAGLFALLGTPRSAGRGRWDCGSPWARRGGAWRSSAARGARPVMLGLGAGLIGALWIADAVKPMLYDVPSFDAASFLVAFVLLVMVALAAALLPARRAANVDPLVALREP